MNAIFTQADVDSAIAHLIADYADVPLPDGIVTLELLPQPIAWLSDMPGHVSFMVHEFPVQGTPQNLYMSFVCLHDCPRVVVLPCAEHHVLPTMSREDAEEVILHAYHSGASALVTSWVRAHRGHDAMHDFADTQSMYGMPGAPELPEEKLMWLGSGL